MDRLIAVSDRANLALHALALAASQAEGVTAREAAERLGVSQSYLAKILQPVAKAGYLVSSRGAAGGFVLGRAAETISCLEVLELLDGPLPSRACLFKEAACAAGVCALKTLCDEVVSKTHEVLARTTIASLAKAF